MENCSNELRAADAAFEAADVPTYQDGDRIVGVGNPYDDNKIIIAWQRADGTHYAGEYEFRATPAAYREPVTAAA